LINEGNEEAENVEFTHRSGSSHK